MLSGIRDPGSGIRCGWLVASPRNLDAYAVERAANVVKVAPAPDQQRLRPERGAKSPSESAWGWGPTRIKKCLTASR